MKSTMNDDSPSRSWLRLGACYLETASGHLFWPQRSTLHMLTGEISRHGMADRRYGSGGLWVWCGGRRWGDGVVVR